MFQYKRLSFKILKEFQLWSKIAQKHLFLEQLVNKRKDKKSFDNLKIALNCWKITN